VIRRQLLAVTSATAILGLAIGLAAPAAEAKSVTTGANAYAAGANTGSANLTARLTLTGAVGGLLDGLISPIVNSALNPLVSALQSTVNSTVAGLVGASSSNTAGSPSQQANAVSGTFPNETFPSPCTASSTTQPCFATASVSTDLSPLAKLSLGAVRGFTQQTQTSDDAKNAIYGRAQITNVSVSALPGITSLTSPLVSASAVDAKASCPNDGTSDPSASVSASNVSLLGGKVTLGVLNGAITSLVVNGTSVGSLAALTKTTIASGITVQSYGTAVKIDVTLSLSDLLSGLHLDSSAVSELLGDVTSSSLTLSVVVGPNSSVTSTTAKAWGLGVGVDLSGSLQFSLLGLAGARVSLPTGIGSGNYGNLVDLRLAYASCGAGSATTSTSTPAVPPANV